MFFAERLTSNYEGEISQSFVRDIHHKYFNNRVKFVLIGKDGGIKDQKQSKKKLIDESSLSDNFF